MKHLNFVFCVALTLIGSVESFATSPIVPYVPKEAFRYQCQLTARTTHFQSNSGHSTRYWISKATVELDNAAQSVPADKIKWNHMYTDKPGDFIPATGKPTAASANTDGLYFYLSFDYPEASGRVKTHLKVMRSQSGKTRSVHSLGEGFGTFSDKFLGANLDSSVYDDATKVSLGKSFTAECERTR